MSDWTDDVPAKRFAYKSQGKQKGKGRHGRNGNNADFQPRNLLGRYTVKSSKLEKLRPEDSGAEMWLEIHELVANGTAYLASFDFGILNGVMLIAGSRRSLREAIELEDDQTDSDTSQPAEEVSSDNSETAAEADIERPPERVGHAFEKNTFRTPKWFAMWRGKVLDNTPSELRPDGEDRPTAMQSADKQSHNAHLEFSTAACSGFEGTLTCPQLGLKEISWSGIKLTVKSTPAPVRWSEYE